MDDGTSSTRPRLVLVVDGRAVAPAEVASGPTGRGRGLLGRDGVTGAFVLRAGSVHTIGMRFALDVAFCARTGRPPAGPGGEAELRVVAVATLPPGRISRPRGRARHVVEAAAGSFSAWGLGPGSRVQVVAAQGAA